MKKAIVIVTLALILSTPGKTVAVKLWAAVPENSGRVIMTALHGVEIRWSPKIGTYRLEEC